MECLISNQKAYLSTVSKGFKFICYAYLWGLKLSILSTLYIDSIAVVPGLYQTWRGDLALKSAPSVGALFA